MDFEEEIYGRKNMKIFLSWSGAKSLEVAKILKEYIPCVIQNAAPYFSSSDIDKGARWSTDIAKELEEANFGILCVTKENIQSQWLNFEAGALSKAIDKAKVCPFLFDLKPSDIKESPILQFQMTNYDKEDIFKLFQSINGCLGDKKLEEFMLEKMFSTFWTQIDEALKKIGLPPSEKKEKETEDNQSSILEEMLELLRYQQVLLRDPERILPPQYFENVMHRVNTRSRDKLKGIVPIGLIKEYRALAREIYRILSSEEKSEWDLKLLKDKIMHLNDAVERMLSFVETDKPTENIRRSLETIE